MSTHQAPQNVPEQVAASPTCAMSLGTSGTPMSTASKTTRSVPEGVSCPTVASTPAASSGAPSSSSLKRVRSYATHETSSETVATKQTLTKERYRSGAQIVHCPNAEIASFRVRPPQGPSVCHDVARAEEATR